MFDLKSKLRKTREGFVAPLKKIFNRGPALSEEDKEAVEALLIGADVGVEACDRIMERLRESSVDIEHQSFLREELLELLSESEHPPTGDVVRPKAVIVIGVNGTGKTTSIAKLAYHHKQQGKKVILAASDTFRAAATEQLSIWADRLGVDIISHKSGGDPAAVAFDACNAAKARDGDYVIIDTAGRLHTKVNLIEELKKIKRVCEKVLAPEAVETYLVLDATLGQNSLQQAREFTRNLGTAGIILTKLDSTAKGGIVVAIKQSLGIPVKYIGAGETVEDFAEFSAEEFVDALLE
ncbi:MAG: signal recognition particle-docking protein FtsY [Candidatus Latescibacteria bacterium]|nr:signal recognition particle-docking protein FtsY [Candidatus Latescibacterota bacterium]NIM21108.1 signal recognition particle-docking protein FtsY [Candidatus Latescibacterota bacterium]NIM65243.1 signal recognition particle-docking protein FtsY [Candidatus Latescibacterota bacterium]NIO01758.1 signal recognition particle-docking protein FtsY [Candidatus Latescibacterota bacterium]NIO28275.1 signal recognition particle-docking protein FtsY [Candidatus Latescibacterota bacterium]